MQLGGEAWADAWDSSVFTFSSKTEKLEVKWGAMQLVNGAWSDFKYNVLLALFQTLSISWK